MSRGEITDLGGLGLPLAFSLVPQGWLSTSQMPFLSIL